MSIGNIKNTFRGKRVKVPTVLQMEAVECGAASLSMILASYGIHVPLEELRVQCAVSKDGSKAKNILQAASKYGLDGKGYKKEAEDLRTMNMPVIIHWNFNHFLVLEGIKGNKVYLNDPAIGRRVVSYEELKQSFTGIVLCFKPEENFNPATESRPSLKILSTLCRKNVTTLLFLGLTGLLLIAPGLIIPMISQFYVDTILSQKQTGYFPMLAVAFALVLFMKLMLSISEHQIIIRLKTKLSAELSGTFLWKLIQLPSVFFSQRYAGDLANRINSNMSIAKTLSSKLMSTVVDVFMALLYLLLLFRMNFRLTIICILITLINVFVVMAFKEKLKIGSQLKLQESGILDGVSINGLQMMETLKSGGNEDAFFSKWAGYQAKYVNSYHKISSYQGVFHLIPSILVKFTEVIILIICARNVMNGVMTFGMFIAYEQLMSGFLSPIERSIGFAANFREMETDIRRTTDVMNYREKTEKEREKEIENSEVSANKVVQTVDVVKLQGGVRIDNVSFGYNPFDPPFIENFSVDMYPGMKVAIVGSSSCGKSTVAKLISGLNKPWSGSIYFDDLLDSNIPKDVMAASVSIVNQDSSVFYGTIKDNITMWVSDTPEEDIIRAAKDACIHDDIMKLSLGYDSIVEEEGRNLSGGQLQRLEIARALVTNPRVIIMDEATSSLDVRTEGLICDNIHRRGCTSIIITHRLSTIKDADLILVLDKGKIVQSGTHEELAKQKKSLYASLIKAQ